MSTTAGSTAAASASTFAGWSASVATGAAGADVRARTAAMPAAPTARSVTSTITRNDRLGLPLGGAGGVPYGDGGVQIGSWCSMVGTGRSSRLGAIVEPAAERHVRTAWDLQRSPPTDVRGGAMPFSPYLAFAGNCREAFTRYREIFGGDLVLLAMSDMPTEEPVPEDKAALIMHAALTSPDA